MPGWQKRTRSRSDRWLALSMSLSLRLSLCHLLSVSLYLSLCLSICHHLPINLSIYLSIFLSIHFSVYLSISLPISLPIYLSVYLSICLSLYQYLSISLSIHPSTAACTFSISERPKVERTCCVFRCFEHVDFQMCFAPKCGALFQHPTFQECSERGALQMLTSKCASRHNGVHFLSSSSDKSAPNPAVF